MIQVDLVGILSSMVSTYIRKRFLNEQLIEHSKYLDSVIELLPTALVIIDAETRTIISVNNKASEITGYNRDEFIGYKCYERICLHRRNDCSIIGIGQSVDNAKCSLQTKSGSIVVIMKSVVSTVLNGKVHLLESFTDITELEKARQNLKDSEYKFRTLFETIPTAMLGCTCDGTVVYWNEASEALFGYKSNEIIGSNVSIITPSITRDAILKSVHTSCIDLIDIPPTNLQLCKRDGSYITVHCLSKVVDSGNHEPTVYCLYTDITHIKQTEQKLRDRNIVLNSTVDLIDGYMWNKDSEGRYLYCTPKWKSLFFGLSELVDIVGKTDIELLDDLS